MIADVVDPIRRQTAGRCWLQWIEIGVGSGHPIQRADHPFDDVIDVGEIAGVLAVVEDVDRLTGEDLAGEQEQCHVRPTPRTIHGEEAQPSGRQAEQVAIGMRHQFVGLLAGCIQTDRMVDTVFHRERQLAIGPIHRAGAGIDQMLDRLMTTAFQNVQKPDDIGIDVGARIFQ